jgi:hypothetical protein
MSTLTPDALRLLDAYWRTANLPFGRTNLSAGQAPAQAPGFIDENGQDMSEILNWKWIQ